MKKNKSDFIFRMTKLVLEFSGNHPAHLMVAVVISLLFLGIKTCADEIGAIIVAWHICR